LARGQLDFPAIVIDYTEATCRAQVSQCHTVLAVLARYNHGIAAIYTTAAAIDFKVTTSGYLKNKHAQTLRALGSRLQLMPDKIPTLTVVVTSALGQTELRTQRHQSNRHVVAVFRMV
jgi:transketolase N-terminal domain/subunit